MEFYKIDAGIDIDSCVINGNNIEGRGDIIYFLTKEEYNAGVEHLIEPFKFVFNIVDETIAISGTGYADDIDIDSLIDNIKTNVYSELEIEGANIKEVPNDG